MTYNIHSGFGRDGYDLHAIRHAIEHERIDLVALQEVDFGLRRTGYVNQARWLGDHLRLHAITGGSRRQGRYGNALLTRWPATFVMNHNLTVWPHPGRACLEVHLATPRGTIRCYVTHLGLLPQERTVQVSRLLEEIVTDDGHHPLLLMGDFNTVPRSQVSRQLRSRFTDVFGAVGNGRSATFHARLPGLRFDYIYAGPRLTPLSAHVSANPWSERGSDHLPLVAVINAGFGAKRA